MLLVGVVLGAFIAAYTGGEVAAAWVPTLGLMVGSYIHAETSGHLSTTIQRTGHRRRIMLPDLIGMRVTGFLTLFVSLLVAGLVILKLNEI